MTMTEHRKKQRHGRITSTRAPAIIGCDPGLSLHGVTRKILGIDDDSWEPGNEPLPVLRGQLFEDGIVKMFERITGMGTRKEPFRIHGSQKYIGTSVDRIVVVNNDDIGALEAKSYLGNRKDDFGEDGSNETDERTFVQATIHMAVLDLPRCWVPVDMGFDFKVYLIERDREVEDAILLELENYYHEWVEPNLNKPVDQIKLPPVDGKLDTTEWIKRRYKEKTNGEIQDATDQHYEWAKARNELRDQIKQLEEQKAELENRLKDEIGQAGVDGFKSDLCSITWKEARGRPAIDWRQIAIEGIKDEKLIKELEQKHTFITPSHRRLNIRLKK